LHKLNVCWNNVYRKKIRIQMWESVKELQFFVDVWILLTQLKNMFLQKLLRHNNVWLNVCVFCFKRSTEFLSLCRNFDLVIDQCSVSNVKCNEHLYSPRMVEEIKEEEKNGTSNKQTVIWPNYLNYLNYSV